jgi:4-hydroxy-tetrahydrodipicolinate synthase
VNDTALTTEPADRQRPFGENLVAMVTPFTADGALDLDGAVALAERLAADGCDGVVLNGTTGEAPVTSDQEKATLVRAVVEAVGDRMTVIGGAGTYDTAHSVELAEQTALAGASGLLVVTPYYSRPAQEGVLAHFRAVADATDLPVMLYDIPPRAGIPIEVETLQRLAEHPRIVAVKDAKGDLLSGSEVMATTGLAYYSGDDALALPWLSVGAVGLVSVTGHVVPGVFRDLLTRYRAGDVAGAARLHADLVTLFRVAGRCGGVPFAKAALDILGYGVGDPRLPNVPASLEQRTQIASALKPLLG